MKLAKLALLALALTQGCRSWPDDQGTFDRLRDRLDDGATSLDMATLTPFKWSRLEIFGPYTGKLYAEKRLGFPWEYPWPERLQSNDGNFFFVFVDGSKVVGAFELSSDVASVASLGSFSPEAARFLVESRDKWKTLRSTEPEFESDLWPGEGIPVIEAVADTLVLFAQPRLGYEPIARRAMTVKARVPYDSIRYTTVESAPFLFADSLLRGQAYGMVRRISRAQYYGEGRDTVVKTRGVNPRLLQYRTEGTCFLSVATLVLAAECPRKESLFQGYEDGPRTLLWARSPGPGTSGWFLVSDSTARIASRRY